MAELGDERAALPRGGRHASGRSTSSSASASSRAATSRTSGSPTPRGAAQLARELVRPGDAVLVKGSRSVGLEVVAEALARGGRAVTRVLIAALVALIVSILDRPAVHRSSCARTSSGSTSARTGPEHHSSKQGTPTMGGLMILFAATVAFLPVTHFTLQGLTVLFATLACGAIGFLDDFIKLTHRRSLGLSGRWKMLLLVGIAVIVAIVADHLQIEHSVFLPIFERQHPALVRLVRRSSS